MNKKNKTLFSVLVVVSLLSLIVLKFKGKNKMIYQVSNQNDLIKIFPRSTQQIKNNASECIKIVQDEINKIINQNNRTFENTAKALDNIGYYTGPVHSTLHALEILSPDKDIREAAHAELLKLTNFLVDNIATNVKLYKAFKDYVLNYAPKEDLNETQKYFISETLKDFKRSGLDLPGDQLEQVRKLSKDIAELSLKFESNIAQHKCEILVTEQELDGVDKAFIDSLPKNKDGKIILGCDYPTYFTVMDNCNVESTRKQLYLAFQNRAYPKNMPLLDDLIKKRNELAKLIGYESYAHLTLDKQMAQNPARVQKFLDNLIVKAKNKSKKELELIKKDLPSSVKIINGKIAPWDSKYLKNYYKKKYLKLDDQEISQYFQMEHTIKQLLYIYEEFLSIKFKEVPISGLWHEDIKLIEAFDKHPTTLLGYILLDLYPRENKYNHAAHTTIVHAICDKDKYIPYVGVVIANFPKSTQTQPSLLKFKDVTTFFHEFGHAIHALLGCTTLQSFSGTNVKTDFVEMPSQMLEDWMHDKEILQMVSKHYKTGEPLPESIIDTITELEKFDSGDFVLAQAYYAYLSLNYYLGIPNLNTQETSKKLYNEILSHLLWTEENHMQASFGHLTGYGPAYYGYLWSKVFAKDMFAEIKKIGLLNPQIGQSYILNIIGQGGSKDPNILLENFLGRQPNEKAFLTDLDLNS